MEDFIHACMLLKVFPKKYDADGWSRVLGQFSLAGADVEDINSAKEQLPKSRKDMEAIVTEVRKKMSTPQTFGWIFGIDADKFFGLSEEKQSKEFEQFIHTVESADFPPYILEVDPILQNFICENFMYTYAKDGKAIVYARALNSQGNVWEEVGDSEKPFTKTKGKLRSELTKCLVIRSLSRVVTVFVNKDGEQKVYEHIEYWKMHKKNLEKTMSHISGSPENINRFKERVNAWIDMLKRCYDGKLTHIEIQRGLQNIPLKLAELDEGIDNNTFFYHDKIDLPMLTNDPNEPAMAYFDLNTITEGETPDFDGFLTSIHPACRDSFMAAIYATFFAKSQLNQYIWMHGEGGDGKSSVLNAIAIYAGDHLACSLSASDMKSEFGLENTVGKRLVIMSDVKTGLSVKTSLIHNLTGHDLISINRKNKPVISARLNPIVWIAANDAPDVNFDNRNEARRCLYIKMVEPPLEVKKKFYFVKEDGTIETDEDGQPQNNGYDLTGRLVKEMPHILFKCREAFNRVCPAPYSVIKQTSEAIHIAKENCLDIDAATFNTYIQETFSFDDKEAKMLQTEIFEAMTNTMRNHDDKSGLNQFAKRDIRRLLTTKYGCGRKKIEGIYYMTGIKRKVGGGMLPNRFNFLKPAEPDKQHHDTVGEYV